MSKCLYTLLVRGMSADKQGQSQKWKITGKLTSTFEYTYKNAHVYIWGIVIKKMPFVEPGKKKNQISCFTLLVIFHCADG